MSGFKSLCVFLSSELPQTLEYAQVTRALGEALAERKIQIVYGGGSVGLMRELANAALKKGGEVVGVIPKALVDSERVHPRLSHVHVVDTLAERKAKMESLSEGFIALPGGLGTLNELFEMWTWRQLSLHQKPLWLLNVRGFFNPLIQMLHGCVSEGFVSPEDCQLLRTYDNLDALLSSL